MAADIAATGPPFTDEDGFDEGDGFRVCRWLALEAQERDEGIHHD